METHIIPLSNLGLALGGGGARGLAHILALETIDDLDIKPTAIALLIAAVMLNMTSHTGNFLVFWPVYISINSMRNFHQFRFG